MDNNNVIEELAFMDDKLDIIIDTLASLSLRVNKIEREIEIMKERERANEILEIHCGCSKSLEEYYKLDEEISELLKFFEDDARMYRKLCDKQMEVVYAIRTIHDIKEQEHENTVI